VVRKRQFQNRILGDSSACLFDSLLHGDFRKAAFNAQSRNLLAAGADKQLKE